MRSIVRIGILILLALLINSCKKDKPTPPVVTTAIVSEITYTTANSGGEVSNDGGGTVTSRGICWNTSASPTIDGNRTIEPGSGPFVSKMSQLSSNTPYYVRAYATNTAGTGYGNQVLFTTAQVAAPVLTTIQITAVTPVSAASGGNITTENGGAVTERGVCWSVSENPTVLNSKSSDGTGTGSFTSQLTGLSGSTKYYLRAYATNSAGTSYGPQLNFTTDPPTPPVLTSIGVTLLTTNSLTTGGVITNDGGAPITSRGICWSTEPNPTTANNKTTEGSGSGSFLSNITGLIPVTLYYLRAYATNSVGTTYGAQLSNKTFAAMDVEGNGYSSVTIGTQTWFKENLRTTKYNNGEIIGTTTPATKDVYNEISPKYQWATDGNESKATLYGRMYTWFTVTDTRKVCPAGWHVPTDAEWTLLYNYLINNGYGYGGSGVMITKSMAAPSGWQANVTPGTAGNDQASNNSSGFTGMAGGSRSQRGPFLNVGVSANWWTSTSVDSEFANARELMNSNPMAGQGGDGKICGKYVRCLKD